jgi:hypothetical protein
VSIDAGRRLVWDLETIDGRSLPNFDRTAGRIGTWRGAIQVEKYVRGDKVALTESMFLAELDDLLVEPVTIGQGDIVWNMRRFSCTSTTAGDFIRFLTQEVRQGGVDEQLAEPITALCNLLSKKPLFTPQAPA